MTLRVNVGGLDRILRVAAGSILLPGGFWLLAGHYRYALLALALGLVNLVTGMIGFCPLYLPFGISTARNDEVAARAGPQRGMDGRS